MMKFQKIVFAFALISFLAVGCKNEAKKEVTSKQEKTAVVANVKEFSLNISGMTCEIGCARKIASDLSKKEGVLKANVVFNDSIANVKYDANITNKTDLIAFVEGIGNGKMYKVSETSKKACSNSKKGENICDSACKKACASKSNADKKACSSACEKTCASKSGAEKKACTDACEKACCVKNDADKKACNNDCKKKCCDKKA